MPGRGIRRGRSGLVARGPDGLVAWWPQAKTTQDAAGASTDPAGLGTPVAGSTSNQVTSPDRSFAAYSRPEGARARSRGQWPPQGTVVTSSGLSPAVSSARVAM